MYSCFSKDNSDIVDQIDKLMEENNFDDCVKYFM